MARIRPRTPDEVGPETRELFERFRRERGNIPNMFRTMALRREIAATAAALAAEIAVRIVREGGAALISDYGGGAPGDTLQAVRRHRRHSPFESVGEADLSAHVDFAALGAAARQSGASVCGPVPQGRFLSALGLEERARRLAGDATPPQQAEIAGQVHRLTDAGAMGSLFQVMSIVHPALGRPAGFES